MKKTLLASFLVLFVIGIVFLFLKNRSVNNNQSGGVSQASQQAQSETQASSSQSIESISSKSANPASQNGFLVPISRAAERVTKKPFGIFIAPGSSPVSPERFRGYHTGTDFEIFPEEIDQEVQISAVCDGTLRLKEYASGYGGVAVETCNLNGIPITVIYGHLKLASIAANVGESLKAGDRLGILGAAYSQEADGERKHLHLGFHNGSAINILGYVQSQSALSAWLDPCLYVCR